MTLKNILKNENENNSKYVYRVLKNNIMNLNLKPGEFISEISISKVLHLSRTPIREALIKLSDERLIDVIPQKKSMITKLDLNLIHESVFMRGTLEKQILSDVLELNNFDFLIKKLEKNLHFQKNIITSNTDLHDLFYLDNEFHKLIFESVNMGRVWKIIMLFNTHHSRLRLLEFLENKRTDLIIKQHENLINLLKNREIKPLQNFVNEHLSHYKINQKELKIKYPNYFINVQ
ncbi:GntR family transcriptional regulator [Ilyobacter sp.]|uniref:GntR family transcriptional regulator n=1 Tax=Ilyobacter sp. TaxID=3100343 RepID=UPI003561ED7D